MSPAFGEPASVGAGGRGLPARCWPPYRGILLYGQIGTRYTFFFGTFLVPQIGSTHRFARLDLDAGHIALRRGEGNAQRDYLPGQRGAWVRDAAGAGLRVYVKSVVLPLVGFDVGYGREGRAFEVYFELGLTDF